MSSIVRINPGTRFSQAVIHGGVLYVSGQVDATTADVATQTRGTLAKIDAILKQAGVARSDLLFANVWLSDIATFDEMNAEWEVWIDAKNAPARATVESRLAKPEYKVEICVIAAVRA